MNVSEEPEPEPGIVLVANNPDEGSMYGDDRCWCTCCSGGDCPVGDGKNSCGNEDVFTWRA